MVGDDGMSSPEAMRAISEIGVRRGERDGGQWDTELQMPQSKGASSNRIWAAWSLAFDRARTVRSQRTKRSLARLQAPQISSATTAFSTSSTSTRQTQVLVEGALGVHKALVCLTRLPKLLLYFSSEGGVTKRRLDVVVAVRLPHGEQLRRGFVEWCQLDGTGNHASPAERAQNALKQNLVGRVPKLADQSLAAITASELVDSPELDAGVAD